VCSAPGLAREKFFRSQPGLEDYLEELADSGDGEAPELVTENQAEALLLAARRAGLTDQDLDLLTDQQVMTVIAINHYQMTPPEDADGGPTRSEAEAAFFNI
jgi:hypothetical protein